MARFKIWFTRPDECDRIERMALTASRPELMVGDPSSIGVAAGERQRIETASTLEERQQYDFSWLEQAVLLHRRGERAQALDIVYDAVDDLLSEGEFKQVNSLLNEVYVENLPSELLLGLLTITLAASPKLVGRSSFYAKVWYFLERVGEPADEILHGLG